MREGGRAAGRKGGREGRCVGEIEQSKKRRVERTGGESEEEMSYCIMYIHVRIIVVFVH